MHQETSGLLRISIREIAGALGAILWTLRLASQVIANRRRGAVLDVGEVSGRRVVALACFVCWLGWAVCAYLPLAVTSISAAVRDGRELDVPAIVQPHVGIVAFIALAWQICVYEVPARRLSAWLSTGSLVCFLVALETLWVRLLAHRGDSGGGRRFADASHPVTIALAVGCMVFGYGPLYAEAVRHQGRGVTVVTVPCLCGILAALNSLFSAVSRPNPSHLAIAIHTSALVLETALLLSHLTWKLRTRRERAVASALGLTFDELAAECAKAGQPPFRFAASRKMVAAAASAAATTTTTTGDNDDDDDDDDGYDSGGGGGGAGGVRGAPLYPATWPRMAPWPRMRRAEARAERWVETGMEMQRVRVPERAWARARARARARE